MTTRVAIYARYSDEDRQSARSIPDQVGECARRAAERGWTVVATFADPGVSGFAMANRPGVLAALAAAGRREFDILLVEDEDRLSRNLGHLATIRDELNAEAVILATLATDEVDLLRTAFKGMIGQQYLIDLGQKTRRGMRSNAEKGLATGSRLYGYTTAPGGGQSVVEAEAEVVRRICALFADDGLSGREIAELLNGERVPGPRGGWWNNSSVCGSAKRGNGVLHSEIYAGTKTWGRMDVRKDPRTGKRRPVMAPPDQWRRTPVEHLRIVPQALWERVQARHAANAARAAPGAARPGLALANARRPGVFSGLLKCAACGSSFTSYGHGLLACAGYRERGKSFCQVTRRVRRAQVEARVLEGLQTRLLAPAAVRVFVRAYHDAMQRLDRQRQAAVGPLERRRAELGRRIERAVDQLVEGVASEALKTRLAAMEAERAEIEARLAAEKSEDPPFKLHPGAAGAYARMIGELSATLATIEAAPDLADVNRRLIEAVRGLVLKIEVALDADAPGGIALRLHGDLSHFLTADPGEPPKAFAWGSSLVAGGSYRRTPPLPVVIDFPLLERAA